MHPKQILAKAEQEARDAIRKELEELYAGDEWNLMGIIRSHGSRWSGGPTSMTNLYEHLKREEATEMLSKLLDKGTLKERKK
jgi:hypothetical protein